MAVVKNEYPVNSGNTGWTRYDVISALENAFAGMDGGSGWHSGTAKSGVPCTLYPPGNFVPYNHTVENSNWQYAGGPSVSSLFPNGDNLYYEVVDTGSNTYEWTRYWSSDIYFYAESTGGYQSAVRLKDHRLNTGDAIVFDQMSDTGTYAATTMAQGVVDGQTYYVIAGGTADPNDWVQLAASAADAAAGIRIDFGVYNINKGTNVVRFTRLVGTNPTVTFFQGDTIYLDVQSSGNPFYVQDAPGAYDVDRVINNTNYNTKSNRQFPTNQGIEVGQFSWHLSAYLQGNYYYVSQLNSSMGGVISVLPSTQQFTNEASLRPYWDYTVSGASVGPGRTDLQLRIYRASASNSYAHYVTGIEILNEAEGWQDNDAFTIPGNSIGGLSPDNDIVFGVNSLTTQQQNDRNGVASLKVVDIGGGGNVGFYQRVGDNNSPGAILRLEHDSGKTYGHTYWGFRIDTDYQIYITSGKQWDVINWDPSNSNDEYNGVFGGEKGLDYSSNLPEPGMKLNVNGIYHKDFNFTTSNTPTSYPLKIVTYQAQSPQDTNFAVIQFVYTQSSIDVATFTFTLLKGTNVGNGIWDLNNVWLGSYLDYENNTTEGIDINLNAPIEEFFGGENIDGEAVRREAFYGYFRDTAGDTVGEFTTSYRNNIYGKFVGDNTANNVLGYYRNSNYDKYVVNKQDSTVANKNDATSEYVVSSAADYYRPFKGLPIHHGIMPCPYYIPDDFTVIDFLVTPGATNFRPGDTITVSAGEVYEIIKVSYQTFQTGLDGVSSNTSKGIALCARTT